MKIEGFNNNKEFEMPNLKFGGQKAIARIRQKHFEIVAEYLSMLRCYAITAAIDAIKDKTDDKSQYEMTVLSGKRKLEMDNIKHTNEQIKLLITPVLQDIETETIFYTLNQVAHITREAIELFSGEVTMEVLAEIEKANKLDIDEPEPEEPTDKKKSPNTMTSSSQSAT